MDRLNPHFFNRDTDTQSLLPHTTKMCLSVKEIKYKLKGPVLEAPNPPSRKISLHFQSLEVKPDLLSFNPMSILGHVSGYKSFSLCTFLFSFLIELQNSVIHQRVGPTTEPLSSRCLSILSTKGLYHHVLDSKSETYHQDTSHCGLVDLHFYWPLKI